MHDWSHESESYDERYEQTFWSSVCSRCQCHRLRWKDKTVDYIPEKRPRDANGKLLQVVLSDEPGCPP